MVKNLVESGRYNSASEVVRDGLRLIEDREQIRTLRLQELRTAIKDGKESGNGSPWDRDDFKRATRERSSKKD